MEKLKRKFTLAAVVALLPAYAAAQQSSQPAKHSKPGKPHPVTSNPCAEYGVGFAKLAGSDTCVKIGGGVRVEGGSGR